MAAIPHLYSPSEKRLALAAVMIVLFLSALDQTIVATAMPRIIADLRGLDRIAWVATAYLLTSTVTVPIYGKLGDLYGRRPILVFGVIVFLIGSALCGWAGEAGRLPLLGDGMNQLIAFRAVQGIGAGALATGAFATVADIVPPAERGRYTGWFGAMFGLAGLAGPVVGGYLTDHATTLWFGHVVSGWRFVFYVNLPLGLVALYVLLTKLPAGSRAGNPRIDWIGSALIVCWAVPLLLALSWGGAGDWSSPRVAAGFATAIVAFAAFILVSRGKAHAVVPLDLFADPVVARGNAALFLVNLGYMGIPMFLPLYLQIVWGQSASTSGFAMLYLLGGVLTGSMIGGQMARRLQAYKPILIVGGAVLLAGSGLLLTMSPDTGHFGFAVRMVLIGLGLGPAQGLYTLAIQSAVDQARVGVATASAQFSRQIGVTVGVAIFGALLTHNLSADLVRNTPQLAIAGTAPDLSRAQALAMEPELLTATVGPAAAGTVARGLRLSFAEAIEALFPVSFGVLIVAYGVTLAVPGRKLRGREPAAGAGGTGAAAAAAA